MASNFPSTLVTPDDHPMDTVTSTSNSAGREISDGDEAPAGDHLALIEHLTTSSQQVIHPLPPTSPPTPTIWPIIRWYFDIHRMGESSREAVNTEDLRWPTATCWCRCSIEVQVSSRDVDQWSSTNASDTCHTIPEDRTTHLSKDYMTNHLLVPTEMLWIFRRSDIGSGRVIWQPSEYGRSSTCLCPFCDAFILLRWIFI